MAPKSDCIYHHKHKAKSAQKSPSLHKETVLLQQTFNKKGDGVSFLAGQYLAYRGHYPQGVFVIKSGKVMLEPHEHLLKKGDVLGLKEIASDQPYCCHAKAASRVKAVFVPIGVLVESRTKNFTI